MIRVAGMFDAIWQVHSMDVLLTMQNIYASKV